jgi:phenylacetate-CoA ligase
MPNRPIWLDPYGAALRGVLWPTWESLLRRRSTPAVLAQLSRTQWCSADELREIQCAALRRLVRHATEHVPYYRARFAAAGLSAEDVRSPEDLRALPLLTRETAREHVAQLASTAAPFPTISKQTSGTSGQPLAFAYDAGSEQWRHAVKLRAYAWAGYRLGDRALYFWGVPPSRREPVARRVKVALDRALKREAYVPCAVMDDRTLSAVVDRLVRTPPQVLVCYTQAGAELARFVRQRGLRRWGSVRVLCGAEPLYPRDRADLEAAFGPEIYETYGCREVMLIGSECEHHAGLHVSSENLVVELLVTEADGTRRPARPGETGEVVLTDLHNYGMPFIRYANGDVAVAAQDAKCECGRALPRIASVRGRVSDVLRDARGNAVSGVAMSYVFSGIEASVRRFQLVQHRDRSVTLRFVPSGGFEVGILAILRARCLERLSGIDVRVEPVADLPRSAAGKHHLVVAEGQA